MRHPAKSQASREDAVTLERLDQRVLVQDRIYDEFVDGFVARVAALTVGDPSDPDTDIGPVINSAQLAAITDKLERARQAGAKQLLGGRPGGPAGLLLPPYVLLATGDVVTPGIPSYH